MTVHLTTCPDRVAANSGGPAPIPEIPVRGRFDEAGFTLLEILIVLALLGMLSAMVWPALGRLDDDERIGITIRRMEEIREAILGKPDRVDIDGNRIIGGFVGDMHRWPFLWEPRPEARQDFSGTGWDIPLAMTPGLGQYSGDDGNGYPLYAIDPSFAYFRPAGTFNGGTWQWHRPFRRVHADDNHHDHIGGPETENEGQPRGLWTRYVEDLPFDLPGRAKPGYVLDERWKGPYLVPPRDSQPDDNTHLAQSDNEYQKLEPAWHATGAHSNHETWEDGDYDATDGPGEHFDEKERFRKLQTSDRLSDGWGRAFRFFITDDPEAAGETLFWIISEGPDGEGTYPNKGVCSGYAWTNDGNDTMERAYDPSGAFNKDNIVMKLASRDWSSLLSAETRRKETRTQSLIDQITRAMVGTSPKAENMGYTSELLDWPALYMWEVSASQWDDLDDEDATYTYGQPRGLWTRTPTPDTDDALPKARFGVGWRNAYITPPARTGSENRLLDAWGRPMHFFRDDDRLLILSAGADGIYDFGDPAQPAAAANIEEYNGAAQANRDNLVRILDKSYWVPGFLHLPKLTILNADAGSTTVRCRLFGVFDEEGERADPVWTAGADGVWADADGDGTLDDWVLGEGTTGSPAFCYDDTTAEKIVTGARYLVCWADVDGDEAIDPGESGLAKIFQVFAQPGGAVDTITIDAAADFIPLP